MDNKTLTEKRQWFLDAAVTTSIPLVGLLDKDIFYDDGPLQNMAYHDFDENEIIPVVADLGMEGIIEVIDYEWSDELERSEEKIRPPHSITPAAVEAMLHIEVAEGENVWEKMSYYRLTTKGGAYWEALAQPNWNDFVYSCVASPVFSLGDEDTVEISGGWQRSIEGSTDNVIHEAMRLHDTQSQGEGEWAVLTPWEATYWKTFSQGHRVLYPCTSPFGLDLMHDAEAFASVYRGWQKMQESERWKVLYQRHWYKSPWRD